MAHDPTHPSPKRSLGEDFADQETLRKGQRLPPGAALGRYVVLGFLGEGGMATVYSAWDPELDRRVAIKLLKLSGEDAAEARSRLLAEAKAMARLSHPNVVPVFDAGSLGSQIFLTLEFEEGQSLGTWLAEAPRSRREVLAAFRAAGEGLAAAHAAGIVHRDFKPDNVLVGRGGRILVSDFGLACLREEGQKAKGEIAGTPAYMAPEQFLGAPVDPRTDQFSFCVALWEALCGGRPHPGESFVEIRDHVLAGRRRAPPKGVPRWLVRQLERGLSLRPEDRFPSLADLLAALRRDPTVRLKRLSAVTGLALVVAGLAGWGVQLAWRERHRCELGAQRLSAEAWRPERRAGLEAAVRASGVEPATGAATLASVDGWFKEWAGRQQAACEQADRDEPGAKQALRCLELQRDDALAAVLALPPRPSRAQLGLLADVLAGPPTCFGTAAAYAPRGSERLELNKEAKQATSLLRLGRFADAAAQARAGLERARAAGALSVAADLNFVLARALAESEGASKESVALLEEAIWSADASGNDEAALQARLARARHLTETGALDAAEQALHQASAWVQRFGSPPADSYRYLSYRAELLDARGRHAEAAVAYGEALALAERAFGAGSPHVGGLHLNYGSTLFLLGRYQQAIEETTLAVEILRRSPWHSPAYLATGWGNLAYYRSCRGEHELPRALQEIDLAEAALAPVAEQSSAMLLWVRGLRVVALELGERREEAEARWAPLEAGMPALAQFDPPVHATLLSLRARVALAQGRIPAGLMLAQEAANGGDQVRDRLTSALTRAALAQALRAANQELPRAEALAKQALDGLDGLEDGFLRERIRRWVEAAQPKPRPASAGR